MTRPILEFIMCLKCDGFGYLNPELIPAKIRKAADKAESQQPIVDWMNSTIGCQVAVCDCCGDGERWYGTPGGHYSEDDPAGADGPYLYNGGLCECH